MDVSVSGGGQLAGP